MKKNITKSIVIFVQVLISVILLYHCKVNNINEGQLISMKPGSALIHGYSFTLTLKGIDFSIDSVIYFNEKEMTTDFIDSSTLTCTIEPNDTLIQSENLSESEDSVINVNVNVYSEMENSYSNDLLFTLQSNPPFKHPVEISSAPIIHHWEGPHIEIDKEDTLSLLYTGEIEKQGLFYSSSVDNGNQWDEFKKISNVRLAHYKNTGGQPSMALDSIDTLHVVYHHENSEYYMFKDQGASEWTIPRIIRTEDTIPIRYRCKLLIDKNDKMILVFDSDGSLYYTDSVDSGFSWSETIKINNKYKYDKVDATITSSNAIVVMWNSSDDTINLSSSHDGGKTWEIENSEAEDDHKYLYSIAASGEKIAVVYQTSDTYYNNHWGHVVVTSDFGQSWRDPVQISGDGNSYILKSDKIGNLHLAWGVSKDIQYRRSIDGGLTWSSTINISQNDSEHFTGRVNFTINNNGYPLIVWENIGLSTGKKLSFANCLY